MNKAITLTKIQALAEALKKCPNLRCNAENTLEAMREYAEELLIGGVKPVKDMEVEVPTTSKEIQEAFWSLVKSL